MEDTLKLICLSFLSVSIFYNRITESHPTPLPRRTARLCNSNELRGQFSGFVGHLLGCNALRHRIIQTFSTIRIPPRRLSLSLDSESLDKSPSIARLITNESGRRLGNNILNIDNSRRGKGSPASSDNQFQKLSKAGYSGIKAWQSSAVNGALNGAASRNEKSSSSGSTATTSATTALKAAAALDAASSSEPTSKKSFQESKSPQTVEVKPQSNQQHRSSSPYIKQLSSPLSRPALQRAADSKKEKRSLKSFFRFSSSNKQQSASGNKKSANSAGLRRQSELNDSRSSLTSANHSNQNQDRAVENLVVRSAKLPTGFAASSESARSPKSAKIIDSRARTDQTNSQSVQHQSSSQPLNGKPQHPKPTNPKSSNPKSPNSSPSYDRFHLNITANNSPNHSGQQPAANQTISSASSFLPSSQSSFSFLSDYSANKNQTAKPTTSSKLISTSDDAKYQFNRDKISFDSSTSSNRTVADSVGKPGRLPDYTGEPFSKTVSTTVNNETPKSTSGNCLTTNCLKCGDRFAAKNSMSNGSNAAAAAAAAAMHQQNADAYQHLSQLSAQQLNQLIAMDQAFQANNTPNSTHSNGTNNTVHDSESSEQFRRRLLCRKCRPNRTGIVQHSHNSNSKFARNLHANPRYGWNVLKEYSKGSIKRLKRHQKRLTSYARAMRKQYNSGSSGGGLTSGDLSDSAHQAALANMVLSAMNTNKLSNLNGSPLQQSSNFCKECYLEKMMLSQQANNGLIGDYPPANKSPVCLSCYGNNPLSLMNPAPNSFDLPHNPKGDYVDGAFVDRFFDVEQWRNKLRKERLRRKERNVLMVVSSIAIIVFIGISYFGTILFLRLTRLQNEE